MGIETIILNARGIKYEVILDTFKEYPNTRLGKLYVGILNRNYQEIADLCDQYRPDLNGEFYFNRDPYVLNMILNYYQTKKLHLIFNQCMLFTKSELNYWGIEDYLLESWCQTVFSDQIDNLNEIIEIEKKVIDSRSHFDDFGKWLFPQYREKVWKLFNNPESSIFAKIIFYISISFILISITISIIKTLPSIDYEDILQIKKNETNNTQNTLTTLKTAFNSIDLITLSFFLFEFSVRLIFCPSKLDFIKNFFNWIDLLSTIPYLVLFILPGDNNPTLSSVCRTLRVLLLVKATRFSSNLETITETIQKSARELISLLIYLAIGIVFFSSIMFYCEFGSNPEFTSIPASFWWAIVTMTTVGYGDITPITVQGKFFGAICAFSGVFILALPITIISSNFSSIMQIKRHEKELIKSIKARISSL